MRTMASLRSQRYQICFAFYLLVVLQTNTLGHQYKVGDLSAWGIPSSANPQVYTNWAKRLDLQIGDSLFFLYPPSQDSVIQVTEQAFNSCNASDPILYMNNGNSLFNITLPGRYYFTSGAVGHCQKRQKLEIAVLSSDGSTLSPSSAPRGGPAVSPSYANAFGSIPASSATSISRSCYIVFATEFAAVLMASI